MTSDGKQIAVRMSMPVVALFTSITCEARREMITQYDFGLGFICGFDRSITASALALIARCITDTEASPCDTD